jgi:hypothetical protein
MTDYVWVGTVSTSASTNTNWIPLGVPAVGDTVTFNATSTQKCEWDIALPATAFSVDEVILDDDFSYSLELDATIRTKALYVGGGTLAAGADGNMKFEHGSSPNEFGSQKSFDERFIMIGDGGTIEQNVVFTIGGTVSVNTYFDDGSYPTVILTAGTFSPQYKTPTGTSGKVSFFDWQIPSASSPTFAPTGDLTDNDRLKVFAPTTFTWSINTMNFGLATVEFLGTSGGIQLPIKGASGYGTDFLAIYRKVVIKANTAGHRVIMSDNTFLSVEEFEVQDGALFKGAVDDTSQGCEIHCISKPKINGTWSFSQITEGIYRSPRHSQGAMGYVGGDFRITGKLTVDGLIDPTGMVFSPQASNPELTNPLDTIWIDSETNHLFRGDRNVESTVHFNVRNDEGATIPVGTPLYSKGEIGGSNRIKVGIADASDPNKMPAIGLAMEEMNTTSTKDGNMILTGILNENITITGVVEQDIIYVAPHGGTAPYLTITRPTSASHLVQNVGVCVRQSATNVSQGMKVAAIGRTNDSPNCSFLTVNTESTHPQARRLVAGTNITLTDGGAGGDLTIAASGGGGGSGTVTSVGFSVPTGFTISGSPITTSGTLGLAFDTGYALPTSAKQTQWDTAYGWGDHSTQGYLTSVAPITLDTVNNRVGINEASPDYDLHVHSNNANYSVKFEHGEGQTLFNRYGHIQIQNDNSAPLDGATLDNPVWQIGQRDGGQLDIALGNISGQLVGSSSKILELKRVGNTASGDAQIGFFGSSAASKTAVSTLGSQTGASAGSPVLPPASGDTAHTDFSAAITQINTNINNIQTKLDALISSLSNLGLI